ncbi:glycoside hydrolase family 88/105 protein [Paenibacillus qinlingensis]|uniref:glycoside hydrolase family 88/105 protein n=1 Tax=Paenibacillus qinlingensis TaxID=1837343 RepID=UPI001564A546|nr:glycoside hydrolase family 88 protein [Paenibacillus qinlingensis]NQX61146.1 glycoside hydrolase family 88 protein [Paenibacillus qinlingensis]
MKRYFEVEAGMAYKLADQNTDTILETIAGAYIANNPPHPFVFRCYSRLSIPQLQDGRFDFNMQNKHPDASFGQYAFALGMLWSDNVRTVETALNCYGPTKLLLNGKLLYKSSVAEEVNVETRKIVDVQLQKGWNAFLLIFRKVASGFGCVFGSNRSHSNPLDFMNPFHERYDCGGWVYSEPQDDERFGETNFPDVKGAESESPVRWLPSREWTNDQASLMNCARLFGIKPDKVAYAWSKGESVLPDRNPFALKGWATGPLRIWVNNEQVALTETEGSFEVEVDLPYGAHNWLVESACYGERDWGFSLEVSANDEPYSFSLPHPVKGTDECWLYVGPLERSESILPEQLQTMTRLFEMEEGNHTFWRVDRPGVWVRPYLHNARYARWNYPIGVTLYGLLQTGRKLARYDIVRYVLQHLKACTSMYSYALWDREQYGYPAMNTKLVDMKMLDDCGSIGSAMLEANKEAQEEGFVRLAHIIADYMANTQERQDDGAFYRESKGYYMENTLWADDLYMSTPFLCRYYMLTGERKWLDDAARQFLLFKKYLYLSDKNLMSHVYDFKFPMANGIPWGRGNGWVLFSLSELLEIMPENHPDRGDLLAFFQEFSEGLLARQGKNGLWHQVLTDESSFEETSCTSMFIYAFARGVRFGWLDKPRLYANAVRKAWSGLICHAFEGNGSVHGVCCGSKYSFSPEYYKYELKVVTNDPHGIGIVLLAGIEADAMDRMLATL